MTDLLLTARDEEAPAAFYDRLCEAVCAVTSMRRAMLFEFDPVTRVSTAVGRFGCGEGAAPLELPIEELPLAMRALSHDRVVDSEGDGRIAAGAREVFGDGLLVCTPMVAAGRWAGFIFTAGGGDAGGDARSSTESSLLWTLGKTAALAMVARSATTQEEHAHRLEERLRMAREIHDSAIQGIFGVYLALSGDTLDGDSQRQCADELEGALAQLRSAIQQPLSFAGAESPRSLTEEIGRLAGQHPEIAVELRGDDPDSVPPHLERLAHSVLVEGLRNALRHASPSKISILVELTDAAFTLELANDGIADRQHPSGIGLRLVGLEALGVGGTIDFGSSDEQTWRLRLVVPHAA